MNSRTHEVKHRSHKSSQHTDRRSSSPSSRKRKEDKPHSHRPAKIKKERDSPRRKSREKRPSFGNVQRHEVKTEEKKLDKEKPNLALSGKLTEDTNTFNGVVVKYNEPPEARKPVKRWRLYPFKGDESLSILHMHRQSAYLIGRDRRVADIPMDHPSISKQHAVFQYRLVTFKKADGSSGRRVKPYIIDLNAANGTYVNNQRIEPQRYVELVEKDVIKFGFSSREYVLLHDKIKGESPNEDNAE